MKASQKYNQVSTIFCLKQLDPSQENSSSFIPNPACRNSYKIKIILRKKPSQVFRTQSSLRQNNILSRMMKSDFDVLTMSSCKFNEINRHVVQEFANKIRIEIENHQIYNKLIESKYILDILDEYQKCYINHQQFSELIQIVLDYMALSKNYLTKNQQRLPTGLNVCNLSSDIASRWLKLKNEIYFNNKDSLKMLQYIFPTSLNKSEFDHSFSELNFDFNLKEVRQVASATKSLCKLDMRAFCYLTNYLYLCCKKMQEAGNKLADIDSTLRSVLQLLDQQNLPAPPFDGEDSIAQIHKDFKLSPHEYQHKYINLQQIHGQQKVAALQNYIERRINEAKDVQDAFNELLKNTCLNYGYHFLSSLKLKDKSQKMAMNRVLQKIVSEYAKNTLQQSRQRAQTCKSIEELAHAEYQKYQNYIKQLINNIHEPIEFKVSDLLRAKCMFANVKKLNHCLSQLKTEIEESGYKIIQLKNRLKKKTSDILIKLLIKSTTAEIQLAIDFNVVENQFNHKIYELRRSEIFSPLTMLKQLNERISNNYFKELNVIINSNLRVTSTHEYFEEIAYQDCEVYFKNLISMLPLEIDFSKPHRNQIDINLMSKQIKRFADILAQKIDQSPILNKIQKLKRNGEYMYQMKVYEQAEKWLQKYCESFKYQHENLFNKVNSNFSSLTATWHGHNAHQSSNGGVFEDHQKYLIKNYAKVLYLISNINMDIGNYDKSSMVCGVCKNLLLKIQIDEGDYFLGQLERNIGWNSFKKGNYSEAIQSYQSYLNSIQELRGTNNMEYALILNNIGQVLQKSGNYNQCLKYFQKSLTIQQSLKGKDSIDCATTLINIGLTYLNQGYYSKSIQIFQRCLQIEEKAMGKDSINCAQTLNNLGNVYYRMGKTQEALIYYKRCLLIQEKVKGKDYIDYAMIINNIGLIYLSECNYEQALICCKKCLSIKQKMMGKSNIGLIATLTNIGLAYACKGDYHDALRYYKRCINIQQKTNNKDNIDYSNTLNNIAIVQKELGNYRQAIDHLERAMTIVENIEGKESMDYSFLLSSLGQVYFDQKIYEYALVHYQIALQNMEKIYQRQSIDCANLINCIGEIHCKMGNYSQALRSIQESLHIKEKIKGRQKIDCASCLNNLAQVHLGLGKKAQAIRMYRQSMQLCERLNVKLIDYARCCLGLSKILLQEQQIESGILREQGLKLYMKLKPELYKELVKQISNL